MALAFETLDRQIAVPAAAMSPAPSGGRRHVAGLVRIVGEEAPRGLLDLGSVVARLERPAV